MLQTLSQRYDERSTGLEAEKKGKLEALYTQLLACGQAMDASKELIEMAQEIYRCQDKRLFLKVWSHVIQTFIEYGKTWILIYFYLFLCWQTVMPAIKR